MKPVKPPLPECEVRALRDAIFGTLPKFRTDAGWEACKDNWMTPENQQWLAQQAAHLPPYWNPEVPAPKLSC